MNTQKDTIDNPTAQIYLKTLIFLLNAGVKARAQMFSAIDIATELMSDHLVDINDKDEDGYTALLYAVHANHLNTVKKLIDQGCDLNALTHENETVLFFAVNQDNFELVDLLLASGIQVNHQNNKKQSAIWFAQSPEMIQRLVEAGADINTTDIDGHSLLMNPKVVGDETGLLARKLIELGTDVNATDNLGLTPLMYYGFSPRGTKALIEAGANVNAVSPAGYSPIYYARNEGVMNHLLNAGAKLDSPTSKQVFALLKVALMQNNVPFAEALLKRSGDINQLLPDGRPALYDAILCNTRAKDTDISMIQMMIKLGANIQITDNTGKTIEDYLAYYPHTIDDDQFQNIFEIPGNLTPLDDILSKEKLVNPFNEDAHHLYVTIQKKTDNNNDDDDNDNDYDDNDYDDQIIETNLVKFWKIRMLLSPFGINLNYQDEDGRTLLEFVTRGEIYNKLENIKQLVSAGADIKSVNHNKETLLHAFLRENKYDISDSDLEFIEYLIQSGIDVNAQDSQGKTALMLTNESDIIRLLVNNGADVNARDNKGQTALMIITKDEDIEFLIQHGADVNARDNKGRTPLMYAQYSDSIEVLLKHGADVNARDNDGRTPIMREIHSSAFELLIKHGANVKAVDNQGRTPWMWHADDSSASRRLKEAGAKVNARDKQGRTPLMYLSSVKHYWSSYDLEELIQAGADVNAKDSEGRTALMYLGSQKQAKIDLLIQAGANPSIVDNQGKSFFDYKEGIKIKLED